MLNYKIFVKSIQIIFIVIYAVLVGLALDEKYQEATELMIFFFLMLLILIELFRGDD